ncbi:MAG: hypothetical protein H7Y42_04905 [Chitinophagaceae bacterium]|nr:hypothetical protein [Chitinophagaceae bacterium]
MKTNHKIFIGIDCGVETGFCVWDKEERIVRFIGTMQIHKAMKFLKDWIEWTHERGGRVKVRVEDARLRTWIPREKNEKAERGRREGAGSIKRDANIWEDYLTDLKVDFEMVAPKNNRTKTTAAYFKALSKYEGPTNEHARDAGMLVIGM